MATLHRGSGSGGAFSVPGITGGQAVRRNAANTGWEGYTPTGGSYTLPAATDSVLGGVKVGDRLTMSNSGVLSADVQAYTLPEAGSALGGIKTGGPLTLSAGTATINDGAITAGMIASGVIPSVPQKATAQEVAEGNDSKFITAAQAKSITQSVEDGAEWSGFSFVSGTPTAGQFGITGTNATGWVFTFATTDANATAMDRTFGENSSFRVVKDATNKIEGETQYAWRSGNSVSMKLKPNATETGDIRSGSATLHGTGGLYEALKDQGFLENTDLREGSNITLTTSGNQVTISASGGGGGSGPSKASQAEVLAGTDDTKFVTPLRAHDLVDHLAHVERVTGLQNATSPNDLPTGRWHINSGGTTAYFRAHTATEHAALVREMLVDRQFVLVNAAGQRIEATFSAVQVNAVSGSDIGIRPPRTIGSHSAAPASSGAGGRLDALRPAAAERVDVQQRPEGEHPARGAGAGPGERGRYARASSTTAGTSTSATAPRTIFSTTLSGNKRLWALDTGRGQGGLRHNGEPVAGAGDAGLPVPARRGGEPGEGADGRHRDVLRRLHEQRRDAVLRVADRTGGGVEGVCGHGLVVVDPVHVRAGPDHHAGREQRRVLGPLADVRRQLRRPPDDGGRQPRRQREAGAGVSHEAVGQPRRGTFYADNGPPFWLSFGIGENQCFPVTGIDYRFRFVFGAAGAE